MNKNKNKEVALYGAGGKGGGSGATEADNTLRSKTNANVLDLISEGEIEGLVDGAKSIYLDETPLQNADGSMNFDATIEFRHGTQWQEPIPGFDTVENEISVGVEAKHGVPVTRSVANSNIDGLRCKLQIPALTYQDTKTGDLEGHHVTIRWEMETGNSGHWQVLKEETITGKTTGAYIRQYYFRTGGEGPWQIRLVRVSPDEEKSNVQNRTFFSSFTEVIESRLSYANSAIVGVSVDASVFSSIPKRAYHVRLLRIKVPSNYDPETRSYAGTWDGTFKIAYSNNPAWCLYDVITNDRYGLGREIQPGTVDKWALYSIAKYCDELVPDGRGGMEPRYTLNCYVQTRVQAYELLKNMAATFQGMLHLAAGSIVTLQDRPSTPEYLFTNANVIGGEFSYQGSAVTARHTVALVSWNDLTDMGRQKVEYVEDHAGITKFGVIETEVAAYGCTSRSQAHRYGRAILAAERLLTETISFSTGIEGVSAYPGMVIKVRDNMRHGKRFGGRLRSFTNEDRGDGWPAVAFLDAPVDIGAERGHTLSVMTPAGLFKTECRWVNGTSKDELRLANAVPEGDAAPVAGATWVLTSPNAENDESTYRIVSVAEDDEGHLAITALQYDEGRYAFTDNINLVEEEVSSGPSIINEVPAIPQGIVVNVINASRDPDTYIGNIEASWAPAPNISRWEVALVKENGNPVTQMAQGLPTVSFRGLNEGNYTLQVRALNLLGTYSPWANSGLISLGFDDIFTNEETGEVIHPFNAVNVSNGFLSIVLGWEYNPEVASEINGVEIWCKRAASGADPEADAKFALLQTIPGVATAWTHSDLAPGASRIYQLRAVYKNGTRSLFYPLDKQLKGTSNVDVTPMLNALEDSFRATNFFGEMIEEIEKVSDLSELLAQSDLTELKDLANVINVDMHALREEVRKVGWNLERDSELILRSVVLTEKARNEATKATASLTDQVIKIEEGLNTGIGRLEEMIAEQVGDTGESLTARLDEQASVLVNLEEALSERITQLAAAYETNSNEFRSLLRTEESARATADEAISLRVDTIYTELNLANMDALAKIRTEEQARTTRDEAIAKTVTDLSAVVKANGGTLTTTAAGLREEQTVRATADAANVKSINAIAANLSSEATALRSLIQTESTARSTKDEALTLLVNASTTAYEAGDSVLATRIQTEEKNRTTADTALAQRIDVLTASLTTKENALKALIQEEATARVTKDDAIAKTVTNLTTTVTSNLSTVKSLIQAETKARTTKEEATAGTLSSIQARMDNFSASGKSKSSFEAILAAEQTTRATADTALTKSVNDMASRMNTFDATGKPAGSVEARLATEEKTRATADSANATSITQLTARLNKVGGASVTLEQKFSTTATALGDLEGKYTVKVNNKGHVSGFGLASTANNGAPTSTFAVAADRFVIASPESSATSITSTPFQVVTTATTLNGQTVQPGIYMNTAYIKNGMITSAKIGDLQVETLKIKDQAITQAVYHQTSGSLTSGDLHQLGDARIMTGAINCSGSGSSGGSFKIVMTSSFLLQPVGDVAYYKGAQMNMRADIIRIDPWGGEVVVRSGLIIGFSRAFSTALYAYGMGSVVLTYVDTIANASAGRWQYAIRVYGDGGNLLGFRVSNRTMMLQEIKK